MRGRGAEEEGPETMAVLIVDDQPAGLLALEAVLAPLGCRVTRAGSGREALRCVLDQDYALILLDVQMPDMDGYETAALIRQRERSRHTPILFVTATAPNRAALTLGYAAGAVDFIYKPVEGDILRSKVGVFLELAQSTAQLRRQSRALEERERQARELAEVRATLLAEVSRKNVELEEARRRAEQMSDFKTRFLAGMSHELRTPLNSIIGFSELLEQELFGPLNPRQTEYVKNVLHSGRHLLSLVNDILDLTKVEVGRMELHQEWVSLGAIVEGVRAVCQPLAIKQGVTLDAEVAEELPEAYLDPVRIKQVLYNLVSNAIKFTPKGGRAVVRVGVDAGRMMVQVTDTGIGIAEEDLPRLFKEFEQIEPREGVKPEGTGLGLALSKRFVELHGGWMGVESAVGTGSTFSVTLPLMSRELAASEPPGTGAAGRERLVLVVEDDEVAAELTAEHLRQEGLEVVIAGSGEEALRQVEVLRPAAITLDVVLPGIDGWTVLALLKRSPWAAAIPVVAISQLDEPRRGFAQGAVEYLVKPLDPAALVRALAKAGLPVKGVREEPAPHSLI